ncbi:DUF4232 domain-containing protein [Streptomyces galilaeus]|uniref:DUF4232 domain-containing protein n=1 Tax=Streptomyces galilaeus TaxID=33899 RepID=UPI00123CC776|nr:DUF4232 domain-containing protein [Streptomyces galilaeus]QEU63992.1 DUF4232 domain-containing protein [Streptomyces galilaeus]GGW75986.1 hypothetical protein GCM10010350_71070 [Streptomyces galilaeus]
MSTVRRAALVLTTLSAALALTACGPAEDDSAGGTVTATPAGPSTASSEPPSKPSKPSAPSTPSGGGSSADYDVFPCSTFDVTFTASLAEPTTSSYLLKVTNKGTKACRALGHPVVTFGDLDGAATERGAAPGIEDALRLEPGESAYAGLMGGADDGKGRTVGSIAMTMNTESDLEQTPLTASTPNLYVAPDINSVTPWVNNVEDALSL